MIVIKLRNIKTGHLHRCEFPHDIAIWQLQLMLQEIEKQGFEIVPKTREENHDDLLRMQEGSH